jgi:hypothetical protein
MNISNKYKRIIRSFLIRFLLTLIFIIGFEAIYRIAGIDAVICFMSAVFIQFIFYKK